MKHELKAKRQDAKLRGWTVTGWAQWHMHWGKQFNMNMDKTLSHTCSQIINWRSLFLPVAMGGWKGCEAVWCQFPILFWCQRHWEWLQLQEGRSDTGIAEGVWQRLEAHSWYRHKSNTIHACTLQPLLSCFLLTPLCKPADKQRDKSTASIRNNFQTEKTNFLHNGYIYISKRTPESVLILLLFGPINSNTLIERLFLMIIEQQKL